MTFQAETRSVPRSVLGVILRVGGSVLILTLLFHFLPVTQVWGTLQQLPTRLWLLVLAGYLAGHAVASGKWRLMVNLAGAGLSYWQAARCYFAGLFSTLFLPSIVGGDVVRAGLALRMGRSKAAVLLGGLIDRILDFVALAALAAFGAILAPGALSPASRRVWRWLGAATLVACAIVALLLILLPARRFSYRTRRRLVRLREAGRSMAASPQYGLVALALAITVQGTLVMLTWVIAEACGLHLMLRAWFFAWPLAKIAAVLPITQGGIGVREAALAALLAPFGARAVLTVSVGLAWEAIIISGGLIGGAFAALMGRLASARSGAGQVSNERPGRTRA